MSTDLKKSQALWPQIQRKTHHWNLYRWIPCLGFQPSQSARNGTDQKDLNFINGRVLHAGIARQTQCYFLNWCRSIIVVLSWCVMTVLFFLS
jgi:hypothetical protein